MTLYFIIKATLNSSFLFSVGSRLVVVVQEYLYVAIKTEVTMRLGHS